MSALGLLDISAIVAIVGWGLWKLGWDSGAE